MRRRGRPDDRPARAAPEPTREPGARGHGDPGRRPVPVLRRPARLADGRLHPRPGLRGHGPRAEPGGRLRRPARPRLRRLLRVRPAGHRLVGIGPLLERQREGLAARDPRRGERVRQQPGRHPPELPAAGDRRDPDLRHRGRVHRPAHAAPARRLHRDRHARLRRDHRARRAERRRAHAVRGQQAHQRPPVDLADRPDRPPVAIGVRSGHQPETVLLDGARPVPGRAVRELPPARLAARPGLDRPARGRGGGGQHGRPARADEAAGLRGRRRLRRHLGRLPGAVPPERQRQPVPVRLLDLHPRHGHPRRPRLHLGRGARGGAPGLRERAADPRRARRRGRAQRVREPGPGLRPSARSRSASSASSSC